MQRLTPVQRIAIAVKYEEIIKEKNKEKMLLGKVDPAQTTSEGGETKSRNRENETREKAAKIAGYIEKRKEIQY